MAYKIERGYIHRCKECGEGVIGDVITCIICGGEMDHAPMLKRIYVDDLPEVKKVYENLPKVRRFLYVCLDFYYKEN